MDEGAALAAGGRDARRVFRARTQRRRWSPLRGRMNEISAISADDKLAQGARPLAMLAGEKLPELIRDEVLAEIFAAKIGRASCRERV